LSETLNNIYPCLTFLYRNHNI